MLRLRIDAARIRACQRLAGLGFALALLGCGGGGSGGDAGGGATPVPPPPAEPERSGLLPAAAAPGAVLVADASAWWPLRDGAHWRYRLVDAESNTQYNDIRVVLSANADGSFRETRRGREDEEQTVWRDASGQVWLRTDLSLPGASAPLRIEGVAWRSPLRVNDQIVTLDRRITNSGIDIDRDGRVDVLEIAVWRTVQGLEPLQLPQQAQPLQALRVETQSKLRITPSSGAAVQTAETRVTTWYAAGIGVVREQEAASQPGVAWASDEWLMGFDAADGSGLGLIAAQADLAQRVPLGSANLALLAQLNGVQFGVDGRGRRIDLPELPAGDMVGSAWTRLQLAAGPTVVALGTPLNESRTAIKVQALEADWRFPPLAAPQALFPQRASDTQLFEGELRLVTAPGARQGWLYWPRTYWVPNGAPRDAWVARRFDASGLLGNEIELPRRSSARYQTAALLGDELVLAWQESTNSGQQWLQVARVGNEAALLGPQLPMLRDVVPQLMVGAQGALWLAWLDPTGVARSQHAMRLDAQLQPVGIGTAQADAQRLADATRLPSLTVAAGDVLIGESWYASGDRWWVARQLFGRAYPEDTVSDHYLEMIEIDPGSGDPVSGLREHRRLRLPTARLLAAPSAQERLWLLPLSVGNSGVDRMYQLWR